MRFSDFSLFQILIFSGVVLIGAIQQLAAGLGFAPSLRALEAFPRWNCRSSHFWR